MDQINKDTSLREKFAGALTSCGVKIQYIDFLHIWQTIEDKYSGRAYHNLDHVKDCIDRIESLQSIGFDDQTKGIMIIALIFHDVEQDEPFPVSDSVYLFEQIFGDCMESDIFMDIRNCIFATDHFDNKSSHPDLSAYIVKDSDLAILGSAPPDYEAYQKKIIKEAEELGMTEENYYIEREEFLIKMLAVPKIYQTWNFGSRYEWTTRNNLQRELRSIHNRKI